MKHLFILFLLLPGVHFAQKLKKNGDFGLKQYYLVLLNKGPDRNQDSITAAGIQAGHLAHLDSMANAGVLCVAGPCGDDGNLRGILIFNLPSFQEVENLVKQDPAVLSGRLSYVIHPWWSKPGVRLPKK